MTPEEIALSLEELFGPAVRAIPPGSWQVETPNYRLLVLLSDDLSWLRILIPIASAQEAEPFLEQLLEANFDRTQEARYALMQGVLWGVFQHSCSSLVQSDFSTACARLLSLHERGFSDCFNNLVENRVRQIIKAAKLQGQSLEATMQTLERFYQEGLMGDMEQGAASREETIAAWRYQLERLWPEVQP
ncbi:MULTISPECIES: hypothetical protein [Aerosakkonema]|uniref:hypothetical protein n=1 Tax=Aerosakkonema TaxID=1246629 RepID=UPI0035B71181